MGLVLYVELYSPADVLGFFISVEMYPAVDKVSFIVSVEVHFDQVSDSYLDDGKLKAAFNGFALYWRSAVTDGDQFLQYRHNCNFTSCNQLIL